jgi:hypothetical protein
MTQFKFKNPKPEKEKFLSRKQIKSSVQQNLPTGGRLFLRNCPDFVAMIWGLEAEVKRIHCSFSSKIYLK